MQSEIAIVASSAILAVGIIGGCSILADALDGIRRLLQNLTIVVNHRHIQGGSAHDPH